MSMSIIELVIDEDAQEVAVDAISLVEFPAIEVNYVALNSNKKYDLKTIDKKRRIVTGPALIPQKQIFRSDKENGDYYIWFSKDTVAKCNELFFKGYKQQKTTDEHEIDVEGNTVIGSWVKESEDNDKSNMYNFNCPVGTWFVSMKIDNDEVWNKVLDGSVRGFSIEGHFAEKLSLSKNKLSKDEKTLHAIKQILKENA